MGTVCGFYRMTDEAITYLTEHPETAQQYIDENYAWVSGKYHMENDVVFETDKAWDIAKFLLKACDTSPDKVLKNLDGIKMEAQGTWDSPRYIPSQQVKEIALVLDSISSEQVRKAYDRDKMIGSRVYRADWMEEPEWDYLFSHIQTIKHAFGRAAECGDGIVINFS